jgi:hypothetical protein
MENFRKMGIKSVLQIVLQTLKTIWFDIRIYRFYYKISFNPDIDNDKIHFYSHITNYSTKVDINN